MTRRAGAVVTGIALAATIAFTLASGVAIAAPAKKPPASTRIDNRSATVYGLKLHYLEAGYGQPLVLLHGLGGSAETMKPLVTLLARRHRVFAPDQLGFGGSDKPLIDYRITTLVEFLHGYLETLGIERADVVGHAVGARVASLYALEHPERVGRLVLISGAGYRPDLDEDAERALAFSTIGDARRALELAFADDGRATEAAAERLFAARARSGSAWTVARLVESFRSDEGFASDLSPIQAPTLIVWGRQDELAKPALAERAHKQIQGSRLVLLDHCGHLPQDEQPKALESALQSFLDPATAASTASR